MKSAAFNQIISATLTTPLTTVTDYARRLKEAGLLSTAPRGAAAPHMTPLDAARLTLAILLTETPAAQCVERVRRFGQIPYSPQFRRIYRGYQTIQPDEFQQIFEGETLEDVLASIFAIPSKDGIEKACAWFSDNVFHLRVSPFEVLAELYSWVMEDGEIVGERVVPFKGKVWADLVEGELPRRVDGWTPIKGGVRREYSITTGSFLEIGIALMPEAEGDAR